MFRADRTIRHKSSSTVKDEGGTQRRPQKDAVGGGIYVREPCLMGQPLGGARVNSGGTSWLRRRRPRFLSRGIVARRPPSPLPAGGGGGAHADAPHRLGGGAQRWGKTAPGCAGARAVALTPCRGATAHGTAASAGASSPIASEAVAGGVTFPAKVTGARHDATKVDYYPADRQVLCTPPPNRRSYCTVQQMSMDMSSTAPTHASFLSPPSHE